MARMGKAVRSQDMFALEDSTLLSPLSTTMSSALMRKITFIQQKQADFV